MVTVQLTVHHSSKRLAKRVIAKRSFKIQKESRLQFRLDEKAKLIIIFFFSLFEK